MNVIRFSDLCAAGKARGQRVFIRADLNVPQDDGGAITGARVRHFWALQSIGSQAESIRA